MMLFSDYVSSFDKNKVETWENTLWNLFFKLNNTYSAIFYYE